MNEKHVVEHNDLITSMVKMEAVPFKLFEMAVSEIDTENPPKDNQITLSKQAIFDFFDAKDTNKSSRFKKLLHSMVSTTLFNLRQDSKNDVYEVLAPITYAKWGRRTDEVIIEFNRHVMPYLIDLKSNFTKYSIDDMKKLDSKYSIVLYKVFCMNYNQFEHYRFKNNRTQKQLEELKNPEISINELRIMTDTQDKYKHFPHFEKKVIQTAVKELNEGTNFTVSYEKVRKGRGVKAIKFFIDKKFVAPSTEYKQEDKAYIEQKQADLSIYPKAVASNYTQLLLQAEILGATDLSDMDLICSLGAKLYPLYDELASYTDVRNHIVYVKDHMDAYSKENLAKYLIIAGETYLKRCKKEKTKIEAVPDVEVPLNSWI